MPSGNLELLALRHEVAILRRQVKRPELFPRIVPSSPPSAAESRRAELMFTPSTILRWHRELARQHWSAFGRRPPRGRPPISEDVRALIIRLATENPRWADRRNQGELLKLGHRVSNSTIRCLQRRRRIGPAPRRSGPTWSQFLRAYASAILSL